MSFSVTAANQFAGGASDPDKSTIKSRKNASAFMRDEASKPRPVEGKAPDVKRQNANYPKIVAQEIDLPKVLLDGAKGLVNLGVEAVRQGLEHLPETKPREKLPAKQEIPKKGSISSNSAITVAPPKAPQRQQGQSVVLPTGGKLGKKQNEGGLPPPKDNGGSSDGAHPCSVTITPKVGASGKHAGVTVKGTAHPSAYVGVDASMTMTIPPFGRYGHVIASALRHGKLVPVMPTTERYPQFDNTLVIKQSARSGWNRGGNELVFLRATPVVPSDGPATVTVPVNARAECVYLDGFRAHAEAEANLQMPTRLRGQ